MAHGRHKPDDRNIGAYYDVYTRALVTMIKSATGRTIPDMMDDMFVREGVAAGILNADGSMKKEFVEIHKGVMALQRDLDNQRKGSRTKKANQK